MKEAAPFGSFPEEEACGSPLCRPRGTARRRRRTARATRWRALLLAALAALAPGTGTAGASSAAPQPPSVAWLAPPALGPIDADARRLGEVLAPVHQKQRNLESFLQDAPARVELLTDWLPLETLFELLGRDGLVALVVDEGRARFAIHERVFFSYQPHWSALMRGVAGPSSELIVVNREGRSFFARWLRDLPSGEPQFMYLDPLMLPEFREAFDTHLELAGISVPEPELAAAHPRSAYFEPVETSAFEAVVKSLLEPTARRAKISFADGDLGMSAAAVRDLLGEDHVTSGGIPWDRLTLEGAAGRRSRYLEARPGLAGAFDGKYLFALYLGPILEGEADPRLPRLAALAEQPLPLDQAIILTDALTHQDQRKLEARYADGFTLNPDGVLDVRLESDPGLAVAECRGWGPESPGGFEQLAAALRHRLGDLFTGEPSAFSVRDTSAPLLQAGLGDARLADLGDAPWRAVLQTASGKVLIIPGSFEDVANAVRLISESYFSEQVLHE